VSTLRFTPDPAAIVDPALKEWAEPDLRDVIDTINQLGGYRAAGRMLGRDHAGLMRRIERLQKRAALAGYSPRHDMKNPVPEGFNVRGVSTYYDKDGNARGQWVKSRADDDARAEMLREWVTHLAESAKGLSPLVPPPEHVLAKLLVSYDFGDPHFGMASGPEDGGDQFDVDEADRITRAAIDRMVTVAPAADTAVLNVIGDAMHANDGSALTPGHKNPLDIDPRGFRYALLKSAEAWRYSILRMLEKHRRVVVWIIEGNHDPEAAGAIALALAFYFSNEPRVEIDLSPAVFRYLRHGDVLLGAHHGDKVKMADLPLLMAVDRPEDWGATRFRFIKTGHIHHDVVKEVQTVRIESLRTLAPKDPYHTAKGYRSLRDTRAVVYHADYGEVERYTVGAAMLEAA
jgi:hypothetical protein